MSEATKKDPVEEEQGERPVEGGEEGKAGLEDHLEGLMDDMWQHVGAYIKGEVDMIHEDYVLLEEINEKNAEQYHIMGDKAEKILEGVAKAEEDYKKLVPHLDQLADLEASVLGMETTVDHLEKYCAKLEAQFELLQ